MITFCAGLLMLLVGGAVYGRFCERIFAPDDRVTPAAQINDGVDFVGMPKWKNCLVQLLDIAGTGPVLGPIQGILFGPVAFITIPIGCVLGGALHDYFVGMISVRNQGENIAALVGRTLGKRLQKFFFIFVSLMLLLVVTVFTYTPGDLLAQRFLGTTDVGSAWTWVIYAVIFGYYVIAALFPIDKIIGRIYPVFAGLLILSSLGLLIGIRIKGYPVTEIWQQPLFGNHPQGQRFLPMFFVTVACGIVSGFHATQSTLVSRTVRDEREGRMTFYNMMILEGVIAMIWALAGMCAFNTGLAGTAESATVVLTKIVKDALGNVGGAVAIVGVIVLSVSSGDTALRSLCRMVADGVGVTEDRHRSFRLHAVVFALCAALLVFSKLQPNSFNTLWRYFSWANQVVAVFSFAVITAYLKQYRKPYVISLVPGTFYCFVVFAYIFRAPIGLNLPETLSYVLAGIVSLLYFADFRFRAFDESAGSRGWLIK